MENSTGKIRVNQLFVCLSALRFNRFVANRWLDKKEDDHRIEIELTPSEVTKRNSGKEALFGSDVEFRFIFALSFQ